MIFYSDSTEPCLVLLLGRLAHDDESKPSELFFLLGIEEIPSTDLFIKLHSLFEPLGYVSRNLYTVILHGRPRTKMSAVTYYH